MVYRYKNIILSGSSILSMVLLGAIGEAQAGTLTNWNDSNAVIDNVNSQTILFPNTNQAGNSSGRIVWEPDEGQSPGISVDNTAFSFAGVDAAGCILAAGDVNCDSPRQSGKRFKSQATDFGLIELQFDVAQAPTEDNIYRVFQRFTNSTLALVEDWEISLGFGLGDGFVSSVTDDELGFFVPTEAEPPNSQLAALFPAGLFSPADEPVGSDIGYFDDERSGFNLAAQEDLITSLGLFGEYAETYEAWLSSDAVPQGFFFDDDGDPSTDALLVANLDNGQWFSLGDIPIAEPTTGNVFTDAPLCSEAAPGTPCYLEGAIEDLAGLNLNYSVIVGDIVILLTGLPTIASHKQPALLFVYQQKNYLKRNLHQNLVL